MNNSDVLKIIEKTISNTSDVICRDFEITPEEVFAKTQEFVNENSAQWRTDAPTIQYSNPYCRLAYIYMNVPIHSHLLYEAFNESRQLAKIVSGHSEEYRPLNVTAFGGGPGSELVALSRYLLNFEKKLSLSLDFLLVDKMTHWDESWHFLKLGVDNFLRTKFGNDWRVWPITISRSFLPLDVTSIDDFSGFVTRFRDVNIMIFSYVFSEVKNNPGMLQEVIDFLTSNNEQNIFCIVVDRNQAEVRTLAKRVLTKSGLAITEEQQMRGSVDLDFSLLGDWYTHMPSLPRRTWQAFRMSAEIIN